MRKFVFGGSYASFTFDPDAEAYFAANTAITLDADKLAIDAFYKGLKADGIYTKIKAMYLPKWGAATNDKWNLIDPQDTNAAFRLAFVGGVTHSTSGVTFNGTNGAANTFLAPSTLTNNDTHLSAYSRTNTAGTFADMGASAPSPTFIPLIGFYARTATNLFAVRMYDYTAGKTLETGNTDSRGFFVGNRVNSTGLNNWKNGINQGGTTYTNVSDITTVTQNIHLGCINLNGTLSQFSNRQYAFFSIGNGLTNADNLAFYNRVNTLMTYFGINV